MKTLHFTNDHISAEVVVRRVLEVAATTVIVGPGYHDLARLKAWLAIPIVLGMRRDRSERKAS